LETMFQERSLPCLPSIYKGSLVGIQNPDLHPGRVMRYYLNPTMDRIERGEVVESYNPLFEVPTTGTLVDNSRYFMTDTQVDKLSARGTNAFGGGIE
jgi:hypothetical protein